MSRRHPCLSGMDLAILRVVDDHPCHGLGLLAQIVDANDRDWVRFRVRRLQAAGLVSMDVPPCFGRGHKIIIRRCSK